MKKGNFFMIVVAVMSLILCCSTMRVQVNYDKGVDFESYESFSFVRPKHQQKGKAVVKNPLFSKDVMNEIRPILESKGFKEAETKEEADLFIHFYALMRQKHNYVPPTYRVGRWGRTWVARPGHMVRYKEGTLVIDIVDAKNKELVWQGVGKGVLNRTQPGQHLIQAVEEVLADFPPRG